MEVLLFCWECIGVAFKALLGGVITLLVMLLAFKVLRPPKRFYPSTSQRPRSR